MKLALKAQIKEQFEGIKLEICSSVHAEVASSLARYVRFQKSQILVKY